MATYNYTKSVESRELYLYMDNLEPIYKPYMLPLIKRMKKAREAGNYDSAHFARCWYIIVNRAARMYYREFGCWGCFSRDDRYSCAVDFEETYRTECVDY